MFDVTNFLMRWLFLSNLVRDVADIQTLPYNPGIPPILVEPVNNNNHNQDIGHPTSTSSSSLTHQTTYPIPHQPEIQQQPALSTPPSISITTSDNCEDEWRDQCLRGILSYPPGTQRLLIMDAMRAEMVERLSCSLKKADQTLEQYERCRQQGVEHGGEIIDDGASLSSQSEELYTDDDSRYDINENHHIDANTANHRSVELETTLVADGTRYNDPSSSSFSSPITVVAKGTPKKDRNAISSSSTKNGRRAIKLAPKDLSSMLPSAEKVNDAEKTIRVIHDYLPQLISIVLKSPPAFNPNIVDPIDKLRRLIVKRCVDDANWGIDMCWLLEAEVGRSWKNLFEHREQTGKRLIIVLQAEKAAVLATIGSGKKEAFDLLQDAEQATAFGFTVPFDANFSYHGPNQYQEYNYNNKEHLHQYGQTPNNSKLPSSLSLRRCSHFGDTMHFIDRLTKISLDMRGVPIVHRHAYLQDSIKEMNRRIRRRMITDGDVSLDVEDHCCPDDRPLISDITSDMLMHSVHLPIYPKQNSRWPGGVPTEYIMNKAAVKVLNIVAEESRILASRERCPYLVRVEVADTNLRGNDSRLYASCAPGLGATIKEALSMSATAMNNAATTETDKYEQRFGNYHIPSELLIPNARKSNKHHSVTVIETEKELITEPLSKEMQRGGWQAHETSFYSHNSEDIFATNPYDAVRENEYQQLHQQMYNDHGMIIQTPTKGTEQSPLFSTREVLLDRIFGQPWDDRCEEIRQASPYGNVEGWRLASFIMKAGEDIRREALVMQIITKLNDWFRKDIPEPFRPHMRPYTIMCVGGDAGLVECLSNAKSVDEVKKETDHFKSLRDYFERAYGPPTTDSAQYQKECASKQSGIPKPLAFEEAQDNFLRSLVGYSLICYILQIKDRHNANILMDRDGNIIHIDFGFVLGDTPKMCKVPIFSEKAPFKLSKEYWEVLGGWNTNQGGLGVRFCHMFEYAFACAAAHMDEIASLVEATMLTLTQSPRQAQLLAKGVRSRLKMRGPPGSLEQKSFIVELVNAARTDPGTSTYDWLQRNMNGYQ